MIQTIDQLNAKILKDLLKDGRKTFTQIAKTATHQKMLSQNATKK